MWLILYSYVCIACRSNLLVILLACKMRWGKKRKCLLKWLGKIWNHKNDIDKPGAGQSLSGTMVPSTKISQMTVSTNLGQKSSRNWSSVFVSIIRDILAAPSPMIVIFSGSRAANISSVVNGSIIMKCFL